jgi:hypothetical protein
LRICKGNKNSRVETVATQNIFTGNDAGKQVIRTIGSEQNP